MELPRDGLEYAHILFDNVPFGATLEASIDRVTWTPITATNDEALLLLRGPDSISTDGLLVPTATDLWVRVGDSPEQVVRRAGTITLY